MEDWEKSVDGILTYARRLEKRTINETNKLHSTYGGKPKDSWMVGEEPVKEYKGKGGFGNALEEVYFGKDNDTESLPDFREAGVELKASPLIIGKRGQVTVKERLVLNKFRFCDMDKETFETSHFIIKDSMILLVFYYYEKNRPFGDLKIDLVDIWECLKHDEAQIRRDWETIVAKIHAGKAEEISEGDTLYLGACTKGATREASMQAQPHSDVMAPGRALCFKQSYINQIYKVLKARESDRTVYSERFLQTANESFETKISSLFAPYIGMPISEIESRIGCSNLGKSRYASIARGILGFKSSKSSFYEFDAADIQIKTVRIEPNGSIKESMSFKVIRYTEIVDQDWEDSTFYHELTSKFIFVVFRHDSEEQEYYLDKAIFWNMPQKDLEVVHGVWEDTKRLIAEDNFINLPKISDDRISHVRPHARDGNDLMQTPSGRMEGKRSFWLNSSYIKAIVQ